MTSTALKALEDLNLRDNNQLEITPAKLREVITELVKKTGGFGDYDNSSSTLQSITAATWTKLTNDGLGADSFEDYLPYFSDTLFSADSIQLTGLPIGTLVTCRIDFTTQVLSNNTEVRLRARFKNDLGADVFDQIFETKNYKSIKTYSGVTFYEFYVGSSIEGGTVDFELNPDSNINALFNGVLITIP